VKVRRRGGRLLVNVRGAEGARVRIVLRRGRRIVARRPALTRGGIARGSFRARRRGVYRVTVLDLGPPQRAVRSARVRVR
jgi:hypothetical protein